VHNNLIEKNLSQYFQDFYITRSSSGTSALIAILKSLTKDSNKDEVIIPSVVCPSVMFAVNFLCLKPVFVDMELKFFNMCVKDLKKKISKKTLAIIGVHCFGIAADINSLVTICKKKKIFLIEDACLNFGGKLNKKYYGAFGDASIVSFGYDKILSEKGGALMIKNKKKFLFIKNFFKKNPEFFEFKFNKKSFQDKFNKLEENIENRKKNAKFFFYNLHLKILLNPNLEKRTCIGDTQ
jgi:dTDP-4-amino-4,6-dideoxygalactose transaminase